MATYYSRAYWVAGKRIRAASYQRFLSRGGPLPQTARASAPDSIRNRLMILMTAAISLTGVSSFKRSSEGEG